MKTLACIAIIALLVAGCGQKGPLYLPEDTSPDNGAAEQAG
ncbi:MAG: lipoprotein [Halomonas sp.]|uniref:Lipoprotein n=1 Tax=Halomonas colorata TaxID=2742615 RepID=A0ABR9FW73_9GAMM|nr:MULTISPECIES: lipoprotein [Halomonas]MBE0462903.1 lipoprotein [Halomonas colorata]MBP5979639.1 lipoprotein [Halomonas sp.]